LAGATRIDSCSLLHGQGIVMSVALVSVIVVAACVAYLVWMVRLMASARREFGSAVAGFRQYRRALTLPVPREDADGLVHRGLRAVFGRSESDRGNDGHLEADGLAFILDDVPGGTRIEISGASVGGSSLQVLYPRNIRAGRARVDRLAAWLESASLDGPLAENHPSYRPYGPVG
jgi:hypothetical protein